MIQSGLDISPVIPHRFPYTEFKEAIELMKSGNSGQNRARLGRTLNQRPQVTQSGEAAAKDLTTDLKLTRYPRSLTATLAAFPSVSLFPQLGSLMTRMVDKQMPLTKHTKHTNEAEPA